MVPDLVGNAVMEGVASRAARAPVMLAYHADRSLADHVMPQSSVNAAGLTAGAGAGPGLRQRLDRLELDAMVAWERLLVRLDIDPDLIGYAIGKGIAGTEFRASIVTARQAHRSFVDHDHPLKIRERRLTISG
jgi:hypothetical protein